MGRTGSCSDQAATNAAFEGILATKMKTFTVHQVLCLYLADCPKSLEVVVPMPLALQLINMLSSPQGPFKGKVRNLPQPGKQDFLKTAHLSFPLAPLKSLDNSIHAHKNCIEGLSDSIATVARKMAWRTATSLDFSQVVAFARLTAGPDMLLPQPEASAPEAIDQADALLQGTPEPSTLALHAKLAW